jgi:CDP-diacylglycerol--glycerol-3-phosphate 3-phosphatidyltransferase
MLTRTLGRYLSWPIGRLADLLAATGIPPNVITWGALVANLWAAILFAQGRFAAGGGMMILGGLCDLLDGPVARRQNRVSLFGAFLDSIFDRYADLVLFLGLLIYYVHVNRFSYAFLAGAGAAGAVMVSYAKARAESLVPGPGVGFWERPERLSLMILCALVNRMPLALWILAIGPNITVVHNIIFTWQQTERGRQSLTDAQTALGISPAQLQTNLRPAANPPRVMTRSAGRSA